MNLFRKLTVPPEVEGSLPAREEDTKGQQVHANRTTAL
jgi:hypothetical protein